MLLLYMFQMKYNDLYLEIVNYADSKTGIVFGVEARNIILRNHEDLNLVKLDSFITHLKNKDRA